MKAVKLERLFGQPEYIPNGGEMTSKKAVNKNNLIWQIGSFSRGVHTSPQDSIYNQQFKDITAKEHTFVVSDNWSSLGRYNLPRKLTGNLRKYKAGVEKLILQFSLEPGYYTFGLSILEPKVRRIKKGANLQFAIGRDCRQYCQSRVESRQSICLLE